MTDDRLIAYFTGKKMAFSFARLGILNDRGVV